MMLVNLCLVPKKVNQIFKLKKIEGESTLKQPQMTCPFKRQWVRNITKPNIQIHEQYEAVNE